MAAGNLWSFLDQIISIFSFQFLLGCISVQRSSQAGGSWRWVNETTTTPPECAGTEDRQTLRGCGHRSRWILSLYPPRGISVGYTRSNPRTNRVSSVLGPRTRWCRWKHTLVEIAITSTEIRNQEEYKSQSPRHRPMTLVSDHVPIITLSELHLYASRRIL